MTVILWAMRSIFNGCMQKKAEPGDLYLLILEHILHANCNDSKIFMDICCACRSLYQLQELIKVDSPASCRNKY